MLLKREIPFLPALCEVVVFVKFVAIDGDFDLRDGPPAPLVVTHLQFIGEPRVGFDEPFIDMAEVVK